MRIREIEPGAELGWARGDTVICITAGNAAAVVATLRALDRATPPGVPVLVCGGAAALDDLDSEREILWVAEGADALAVVEPADAVVIAAGCVVGEEWLERLRAAAYAGPAIATASALDRALLSTAADSLGRDAAAVAAAASGLRPRLLHPAGPCYYVRRSALELAGPTGQEFAARCLELGLAHVLADDVLVEGGDGPRTEAAAAAGPLRRAIGVARRARGEPSVTIDAREFQGPITGRHVVTVELVAALASLDELRVQVLVGDGAATALLSGLRGVTLVQDVASAERTDIVHRPMQVSTPADLAVLTGVAERLLITHHDLIGYHNRAYFRDEEAWRGYRSLTQAALAVADGVVFGSAHARDDALAEELVESTRTTVVPHGVDHRVLPAPEPREPPGLAVGDRPLLLCLGTDFNHKNRPFAVRLLEELRARHAWPGALVLAGPHMEHGSSLEIERLLAADMAGSVVWLGAVSEAEKRWLLERAALVVYPTVEEGFGLVPFEAAAHGTPCLWAPGGSLTEWLPASEARIEPWDAAITAERALELMTDDGVRLRHLQTIDETAARLTWEGAARALVEVYRRICDSPPSLAGVRERSRGFLRAGLSEDAMRLVGPDGALPPDLERPLLALATHRVIARPAFSALRLGYRVLKRPRRTDQKASG